MLTRRMVRCARHNVGTTRSAVHTEEGIHVGLVRCFGQNTGKCISLKHGDKDWWKFVWEQINFDGDEKGSVD